MNDYYPFINLPLGYGFDALEPFIDAKTMYLHHDRHLKAYIDNLNKALKTRPGLRCMSLEELTKVREQEVSRNAGGVYNHRFFFNGIAPEGRGRPMGKLGAAIERDFGSFGGFTDKFSEAAMSVFGSGYAWLVLGRGGLKIVTTPNQETPLIQGLRPVLNIDVWEHAYYLKHYNVRKDCIEDWRRVVNWRQAEKNFNGR